ncbi:twin-arginine translocase TatA/TatE family subunit [candidate division KSB1 bacterium]|nr:twin-arginine translocase TatA/TatE family subunit [candidate division KSB1 bacterium]
MLAFLGFLGPLGPSETIVILLIILILFGAKKLPELAKGLGQGIKEFKKATREISEDDDVPKIQDKSNKTEE